MSFPRSIGGRSDDLLSSRPKLTPEAETPAEPPSILERPAATEAREFSAIERDPRTAPAPPDRCANVIASGARWKGSLHISDSVRIDGQLSGDVDAKGTVHISETAQVEARIKAAFVVISGTFKGEVRCTERLELLPKSKVQGDLVTKLLNVHEGAVIDGSIRMSAEKIAEASKSDERAANGSRSSRTAEDPVPAS